MAYNQFNYGANYGSVGSNVGTMEDIDEEARRRRAMLAGMPEGAGFADMANQLLPSKMRQAPGAVAPDSMQQQVQVPPELPSQGPISPTMAQQVVEPPQLPQPGPAVQVAGPAQMPPPQARQEQYSGPSQGAEGQTVGQAMVQPAISMAQMGQQAQQPVITPEQRYNDQIIAAGNEKDPAKRRNMFAQLMAREDVTEGNKTLANRLIAEDYLKQRNIADAEKKIQDATPNDLARYMREKTKEGSYVKALLYTRLGLNDLAQKEQELLSPTLKMSSATDSSGEQYTVERDKNGAIVRGFDRTGKTVGQEVLANLGAAAMPTQAFLLPQSGGGLMQKTIIGPDGQPQVITGQVFTDPRTNSTYFQAGNKRYDTSGLSTPAQNVQNIYSATGAGQQGKQAATTGVQQPAMPPMAGQPQPMAQPQPQVQGAPQAQPQVQAQGQAAPQVTAQASPAGGVKLTPQKTAGGGTVVTQRPGESFASYEQRKKASEEATSAGIKTQQAVNEARLKPPAEASGKNEATDINNQRTADSNYGMIKDVADLIRESTGSGLGTKVDKLAGFFGVGTKGADAIAKLNTMSYPFIYNIPRFEGPQGEKDVAIYEKAAGDFGNSELPTSKRLAALQGMVYLMKKYDKAGNNDWTFGGQDPTKKGSTEKTNSGTTSSGNKYKKVE